MLCQIGGKKDFVISMNLRIERGIAKVATDYKTADDICSVAGYVINEQKKTTCRGA